MTNPIRKKTTGKAVAYNTNKVVNLKKWIAICQICDEEVKRYAGVMTFGSGSYADTRKQAKDALHRHMKKEHDGPG